MFFPKYPEAVNLFPIYDKSVARSEKELLLKQRGQVFWLTGLSGSGKSTIAIEVERRLTEEGVVTVLLDGDNVRGGLCRDLTFSAEDREENNRRISEVAKIMVQNGLVVLCTFITPQEEAREKAREIIGKDDFHLIYVEASIDDCKKRDPKGLYKKAISGEIENFTGISAPFDIPQNADLVINTRENTREQSSQILLDYIQKHIHIQ